ncbi:MAG: hypothetical protein P0S93_01095 [Candidatus Neptunochlamydia sp.]|nr:hypothetical protein [Candidatus Neptunochlamydia sp.]
MNKANFKKKGLSETRHFLLSRAVSLSSITSTTKPKKIIPSIATKSLRYNFKKTFLPLLIHLFELRQVLDNYKSNLTGDIEKPPQQILERLKELRGDIEETQR